MRLSRTNQDFQRDRKHGSAAATPPAPLPLVAIDTLNRSCARSHRRLALEIDHAPQKTNSNLLMLQSPKNNLELVAFHEMRSATHNRISCETGASGEISFSAGASVAALWRALAQYPVKNGSIEAISFRSIKQRHGPRNGNQRRVGADNQGRTLIA